MVLKRHLKMGMIGGGPGAFIDPPLIAALIGSALLPHLVRWLISRFGIPSEDTPTRSTYGHQS